MVTNSNNIKKNEQSPLIFTQWKQQKTTIYEIGNPGSGLGHAQTCGGVTPVNGTPTLPSL